MNNEKELQKWLESYISDVEKHFDEKRHPSRGTFCNHEEENFATSR